MTWLQNELAQNSSHKIRDYSEIFNARGRDYHEAMLRFPNVRNHEFETILRYASLENGMTVCDYPSGGGYLERYIPQNVNLHLLETSEVFLQCVGDGSNAKRLLVEDGAIPLTDQSADRFISLAGLHHMEDKPSLFFEVYRVLKQGGIFALADAQEGSRTARFLNEFVHRHSENGHEGIFLTDGTRQELESFGYIIKTVKHEVYSWHFSSIMDMCTYCRLLFGINRANSAQIEAGIREYLGVIETDNSVQMNWELLFVVAQK